jgi:hypothetical protein
MHITIPYTFEATIVLPRHRSNTTKSARSEIKLVIDDADEDELLPLVSCNTDRGPADWFSHYGSATRFLKASDDTAAEASTFVELVENIDTDFAEWFDYPFPRTIGWRHMPGNRVGDYTAVLDRRSPRRGTSKDAIERRQWVSDNEQEEQDACRLAASNLHIVGNRVAIAEALPRIYLDPFSSDSLVIHVRTIAEHEESELIRKHTTNSNIHYGLDKDTEFASFPLTASEILRPVLAGTEGKKHTAKLDSVTWKSRPHPSTSDIVEMRETLMGFLAEFRKTVDDLTLKACGRASMRLAIDFVELHDALLENRSTLTETADAGLAYQRSASGKKIGFFDKPLATPLQEFMLKAAIAVDAFAPEPAITDEERRVYGSLAL